MSLYLLFNSFIAELELELIQTHMTLKPLLWAEELGSRAGGLSLWVIRFSPFSLLFSVVLARRVARRVRAVYVTARAAQRRRIAAGGGCQVSGRGKDIGDTCCPRKVECEYDSQ